MKPLSCWKQLRYRLEVAFAKALTKLVPLLPHRAVHAVGRATGYCGYYLMRQSRRVALANLDIAYGGTKSATEKSAIVRASFQNFAATFLSFFWTPRLNSQLLREIVEFDEDSLQLVHEIKARGNGIVFITLHYGDWELLAQATGYSGIRMTIVMEEMRNVALGEVFGRLREHAGHRVILQRFAATKLFRALKRGETVAMLVDLNAMVRLGGVWADFFGRPAFSHSAAAALALRTGAAIVGAVAYPLEGGRMRVVYGPEIPCTRTGDETADVKAISQACVAFCERVIRSDARHWLWSYKRWKYRPEGAPGDFPFYTRPLPVRKRDAARTSPTNNTTAPQHNKP